MMYPYDNGGYNYIYVTLNQLLSDLALSRQVAVVNFVKQCNAQVIGATPTTLLTGHFFSGSALLVMMTCLELISLSSRALERAPDSEYDLAFDLSSKALPAFSTVNCWKDRSISPLRDRYSYIVYCMVALFLHVFRL